MTLSRARAICAALVLQAVLLMALTTVITTHVGEEVTAYLSGTITDPSTGSGFKPSTLTLTLYSKEDGAIINSRSAVNVLDTNGGTVSSGGALVMILDPADNPIVTPRTGKTEEVHCALFQWTWAGGAKAGHHTYEFTVEDHSKVT